MSSLGVGVLRPWTLVPALASAVLPLFALTIFLSALLLFAIEPMFTKMALPLLGGSPSVWSVAMCSSRSSCSPDIPMPTR